MKAYRAYIWASDDNCEEYWREFYIGNIHTSFEGAKKEIEHLEGLSTNQIERELSNLGIVSIREHRPKIEEIEIVED